MNSDLDGEVRQDRQDGLDQWHSTPGTMKSYPGNPAILSEPTWPAAGTLTPDRPVHTRRANSQCLILSGAASAGGKAENPINGQRIGIEVKYSDAVNMILTLQILLFVPNAVPLYKKSDFEHTTTACSQDLQESVPVLQRLRQADRHLRRGSSPQGPQSAA